MAENRHGARFALVPVPGTPLVRLSAIVPRELLATTRAAWQGLVEGVTKYKDWALCDGEMRQTCGEWVYGGMEGVAWENPTHHLFWNPVRTATEAATPVKSWYTTRVVHWPAVVRKVGIFDTGNGFGRLVLSGREAATISSVVLHEVFVRNTPYSPAELACGEPITDRPRFIFNGNSFELPECLHPHLEVPSSLISGERLVLDMCPQVSLDLLGTRVFDATNMTDWEEYISSQEVDEQNGLYILHRQTVLPPENLPNELIS